jgi:type III secretion protein N (ATPase)
VRIDLRRHIAALPDRAPLTKRGRVLELTGPIIVAALDGVRTGELVEIRCRAGTGLTAEVVAMNRERAVLLPLAHATGLSVGAEILPSGAPLRIRAGAELLGRVLDGLGCPIDGRPLPEGLAQWDVDRPAPGPLERPRVSRPLSLGVRAIDALITAGEGQRLGLFAASGVGKSTLLGWIARRCAADVIVIGLIGERGREVREFVDDALGSEGLARSVVVAATSDAPPLVRLKGAHVATAIAEWFADVASRRVLLLLDSVTRVARAQREVGLAAGEPPARQGFPPSVFAELPRLLERAGNRPRGAITAVYTVLVAGDDMDEPISDEVRGVLDGHVILDRRLAARGHHPAIDVLRSVSRVMPAVATPRHLAAARRARQILAAWERHRDLLALGAYARGSDPETDEAIDRMPAMEALLHQAPGEPSTFEEAVARLEEVLA